jgi:hypothetical protein
MLPVIAGSDTESGGPGLLGGRLRRFAKSRITSKYLDENRSSSHREETSVRETDV